MTRPFSLGPATWKLFEGFIHATASTSPSYPVSHSHGFFYSIPGLAPRTLEFVSHVHIGSFVPDAYSALV